MNVNDGQATLQPLRFQEAENALRAQGIDTPTVAQVQRVFDTKGALGLTREVEDFLILAYAIATGRELMRLGSPMRDPVLGKLSDDLELQKPPMPDPVSFQKALDRAAVIFGVSLGGRAMHARNLRALGDKLGTALLKATTDRAAEVARLLEQREAFFEGTPPRLVTARKVAELLGGLAGDPLKQVTALAGLEVAPTSETAMAKHLLAARATAECLADDLVFQGLEGLRGHDEAEARGMLAEVREALERDELQAELAVKLRGLALRAQQWMRKMRPAVATVASLSAGGVVDVTHPVGTEVVGSGAATTIEAFESERARMLEAVKRAGPEGRVELSYTWRVVRAKPAAS